MEEEKIKRFPPPIKYPVSFYPRNFIPYSLSRIKSSVDDFNLYYDLEKAIILKEKYEKLKNGINYNTRKKIQYGKETYIKLLQKLKNHVLLLNTKEKYRNTLTKEDLETIEKINEEVVIINNLILDYNEKRRGLCKKMDRLTNWKDYVIFDGKKYGLYKSYYPHIHLENDCYGLFKIMQKEEGLFYKIKNYLTGSNYKNITKECLTCGKIKKTTVNENL